MKRLFFILFLSFTFFNLAFSLERPQVRSINFVGNRYFSDKRLRGLMGIKTTGFFRKSYLYEDVLIQDIKSIMDFYYRTGFFDMDIKDVEIIWTDDSAKVDIRISIDEKDYVTIDSLFFQGNEQINERKLRKLAEVRPGFRLNFEEIFLTETDIAKYYGERGFLSASVSREIIREGNHAKIMFTIAEGPIYRLGETKITGNEKVPAWLIKRGCEVKTGETLTLRAIENYREKLFLQGIYGSIDMYSVPTDNDSIRDLQITVKEKEPGELSFGGGFDNEEGPRIISQLKYLSLFRRAAGVKIDARLSFYERLFEAQYSEPYFMRSPFYFKSSLAFDYKVEPDYNRQSWSLKSSWGVFLLKQWQLEYGYDLHQTILIDVPPDLKEEESGLLTENVQVSQLFVESIYDTRDSKILTRKGNLIRLRGAVSHFFMKSQPGFLRLEGGLRRFMPVKKYGVLAFQTKCGIISSAGENPVPLEERFFFTGRNNIRGYPKNSLGPKTSAGTPYGGEYYYILRSEIRMHLWKAIWPKLFFDNGGLYRDILTSTWEGSTNGAGAGIRLIFGIWSARLEYAWQLREDQFESGMWYFELGQEF